MKEKIWYEFLHAKYGDSYLCHYLTFQRSLKKWVKIITLIFSTSGIMGWTIWDKAPIVSCAIITAIQLFNLIQKQIILSDADITHISELRALYLKHCNKLEKLWTEFRAGRQTEKQASDAFFKLRNEADKIEKLDTKLDVKQRNFLKKKADLEVRTYVKQYHS